MSKEMDKNKDENHDKKELQITIIESDNYDKRRKA